ncbi:hypothetical protein T1E_2061 [Pseudomonas putida DOT-T1E]|uniref:Uncharacterized protein n=1 Tax=Pseudomonas putida (strain DOT-T1E) TaxID=1196325 RepID=I7C844_PSEPT|nr:hypothetical protein T1E_2061 [Pseudomonas putida DOT-T1E]
MIAVGLVAVFIRRHARRAYPHADAVVRGVAADQRWLGASSRR